MFNKNRKNIKAINKEIENLLVQISASTGTPKERELLQRRIIQLANTRQVLLGDNQKGVSIKPTIVSGLFGLAGLGLVLYFEKVDVITSKAFMMATRMLEG